MESSDVKDKSLCNRVPHAEPLPFRDRLPETSKIVKIALSALAVSAVAFGMYAIPYVFTAFVIVGCGLALIGLFFLAIHLEEERTLGPARRKLKKTREEIEEIYSNVNETRANMENMSRRHAAWNKKQLNELKGECNESFKKLFNDIEKLKSMSDEREISCHRIWIENNIFTLSTRLDLKWHLLKTEAEGTELNEIKKLDNERIQDLRDKLANA